MRLIGLVFIALLATQADGQNESNEIREDASIAIPRVTGVRVYLGDDGSIDGLVLNWKAVPEAVAYHLYLEIQVTMRLDEAGDLVLLDEPQADWVPWARIDAVPGEGTTQAIVTTLDDVISRWGLATVVERDGQHLRSSISLIYIPQPATAVAKTSWGRVKGASK